MNFNSPQYFIIIFILFIYSKTCLKQPFKKKTKIGFKTNYCLMQVKSIAECPKGSILQYFRPSLSYHLSLRYLFCLFLSGRLRQGLLYIDSLFYQQVQQLIYNIFRGYLPLYFNGSQYFISIFALVITICSLFYQQVQQLIYNICRGYLPLYFNSSQYFVSIFTLVIYIYSLFYQRHWLL